MPCSSRYLMMFLATVALIPAICFKRAAEAVFSSTPTWLTAASITASKVLANSFD